MKRNSHPHFINLISNIPTNVLIVRRFYFILIKFLVESQEGPTVYSEQTGVATVGVLAINIAVSIIKRVHFH